MTSIATFLPVGVRGLVLAAAMAATMSVSSGTILASSTILYNDLFLRFVRTRPRATDGSGESRGSGGMSEVNVTRAFAALIGVVVMVCSLWINDVLVGIDISYGYLSGCVFVPLVASFVLKRFSPKAGLYALGVSAVAVTGCFLALGTASSIPIVAGMASSLVTYAGVNLASKQKAASPFSDEERPAPEETPGREA
ncbi:sodium:solute symporter family transporter [Eggerthella sinensis]|uniref:sodium:solute symporter family transporter n=1 Tax=Eggerthella sinensis TaxID=242230 RepID=UPI0022E38236|nr:hypothetical protein [Eggerthella sinensis]